MLMWETYPTKKVYSMPDDSTRGRGRAEQLLVAGCKQIADCKENKNEIGRKGESCQGRSDIMIDGAGLETDAGAQSALSDP